MTINPFTTKKPLEPPQPRRWIPADRALGCLDCEAIYEAQGEQRCPACGSGEAWPVARLLDRRGAA